MGGEEEAAEGIDAGDGGGYWVALVEVMRFDAALEQEAVVFVPGVGAVAQGVVAAFDAPQQCL